MHTKHKPDNTNHHSIKTTILPHIKSCPYKLRLISATTFQTSSNHGANTWYPQSPKEVSYYLHSVNRAQCLSPSESLSPRLLPVCCVQFRVRMRVGIQPISFFNRLSNHTWCVAIRTIATLEELHPAFGLRDYCNSYASQASKSSSSCQV